ncbi:MAG: DEAD/DEAH box helicase, partial [Lentisphaeria bacterium]
MKILGFIKSFFTKRFSKIEVAPIVEKKQQEVNENSKGKDSKPKPKRKKSNNKVASTSHTEKVAVKKVVPMMPEIIEVEALDGKISFTELPIRKELLAALQDLNFRYCTPIQGMSLPASLAGKDIAGKAQTGTGKTASFLIAALNHLLENPIERHRCPGSVRVMILAPTRELAIQIHKDCEALCKYINFNNVVIFGGMGHHAQREQLSKPVEILVATPGRCIDFMNQNVIDLSNTEILIIDEADRMLDMGFIPDVRRIVSKTPHPAKRHTMMFSATLTESVLRLIRSWQRDPVTIET